MPREHGLLGEAERADVADEGSLARVGAHVVPEVRLLGEHLMAEDAREGGQVQVQPAVGQHGRPAGRWVAAKVAAHADGGRRRRRKAACRGRGRQKWSRCVNYYWCLCCVSKAKCHSM